MSNLVFGTEIVQDDDDAKEFSRRPLGVQEQVVTDERGRRRFHGAFTGGFSAGFFNTVGSKEGWTPRTFRSTKDERAGQAQYRPEDFMDEEDFGEYGIASRRIHTSVDAGTAKERNIFAWDHSASDSLDSAIKSRLEAIIQPTNDSMGVKLLKKMGWRFGEGIGAKLSKEKILKDNADDQSEAPDDIFLHRLKSRKDRHGLGYEGLKSNSIFSDSDMKEISLKMKSKSKGIRGQAFGVGAFEDGDASIYTDFDWSKYDFAIGKDDGQSSLLNKNSHDTSFVMESERQRARLFFEPPRIPLNFRPVHVPIFPTITDMPVNMQRFGETMNAAQRARFLGEVDKNIVLELICDQDRERLARASKGQRGVIEFNENVFDEEPMKQARFKQFLHYLKRGLNFPQPIEMTSLEWDRELADFHRALPTHLRALLPDVKLRQKPMFNPGIGAPLLEVLKSKFVTSTGTESKKVEKTKDQDKIVAVRSKLFGNLTRQIYDWYPAKNLAKRFNVPDPYPSSDVVGTLQFLKSTKKETLLNLGFTSHELEFRAKHSQNQTEKDLMKIKTESDDILHSKIKGKEVEVTIPTNEIERPPDDFLQAIFGCSDSEDDCGETGDADVIPSTSSKADIAEKLCDSQPVVPDIGAEKFISVMDIDMSDNREYGPNPPSAIDLTVKDPHESYSGAKHRAWRNRHKHRKRSSEKSEKDKRKRTGRSSSS